MKCMLRKEAGKGQDAGQLWESSQQKQRGSTLGSKRCLGCVCINCFFWFIIMPEVQGLRIESPPGQP